MAGDGLEHVTLVTGCKGRLRFIQEAMPTWLAIPGLQIVVVDYDCPERVGDWAEQVGRETGRVRVVRVGPRPVFSPSEMRNCGVAAVTTPWLFLVDSDVCLKPAVVGLLRSPVPGRYYRVPGSEEGIAGTLLTETEVFRRIEGYDEAYESFGHEDIDLVNRMDLVGSSLEPLDKSVLRHIPHGDELRVQFFEVKDRNFNNVINTAYGNLRLEVHRVSGVYPSIDVRRQIYKWVKGAVVDLVNGAVPQHVLSVSLRRLDQGTIEMETGLALTLRLTERTIAQLKAAGGSVPR